MSESCGLIHGTGFIKISGELADDRGYLCSISQNNAKRTAFRITREAEILGGVLSSQLNRESLVFLAEGLKDDV